MFPFCVCVFFYLMAVANVGNCLSVLQAVLAFTYQTFKAFLKLQGSLIKNQIWV